MTVVRKAHMRSKPGGGQTRVRRHVVNVATGGHRAPRVGHRDKLATVADLSMATLAGVVVYGVARMLLLVSLAIATAVATAMVAMIALQVRPRRKRRRVPVARRARRWVARRAKLTVIHARQKTRQKVVARVRRDPKSGKVVQLRKKPVLDGMDPRNWPKERSGK